jgi:spore photoproduct lyase
MCLYCYLVCNYNKCAYLRLFVNREQMMDKMLRAAQAASRDLVFEIGSNSDLVLENTLTDNLPWTIEHFGRVEKGFITFPTKFDTVEPMLGLNHRGRTLFRMSVNPEEIIRKVEFGTSPLEQRLSALNRMYQAGYRIGLLIAPVVLVEGWKMMYARLIDRLADQLPEETRKALSIEIIFMTYSYVHRAINAEAFPQGIELYDPERMTGRGRGKYRYREAIRAEGEAFLRAQLSQKLSDVSIAYIV